MRQRSITTVCGHRMLRTSREYICDRIDMNETRSYPRSKKINAWKMLNAPKQEN
jgi:hypothetical protein